MDGRSIDFTNSFSYTRKEPIGVCAAIGAWNYPLQIAAWKAAPALLCGNTMVFKPSEFSPSSALKLAEIFKEAGLPDGVFNVVLGDARTGEALVKNPGVMKVSITGGKEAGKAVMRTASEQLKKVSLELGGKSPLLVFSDANLKNAVSAAILANFYTQGQICSNGTRVFVQESILSSFIAELSARLEKIVVGDPMDSRTQFGSLIHRKHADKVRSSICSGLEEGAQLIYGSAQVPFFLEEKSLDSKAFVLPCIFSGCSDDMKIVKEEIFGPVMSILSFKDESEIVSRANKTEYGLAAGVMTSDIGRAHRIIKQLHAGTCWVNTYNITPVELPFGGYKQSGYGKENGIEAIESYTQTKSVYVELGDVDSPY